MTRALDIFTYVLSTLLLALLALLSLRGLLDPAASAASFGVPVEDPSALIYQLVYRSRNLVIAVTALIFLGLRSWRPLAILATASISLPAFDIWFLAKAGLPVAVVHPATLAALLLLAALLWRRALRA